MARARRDLSVDEVVDQAVAILRAEGEEGLSMRRLADACGVTPMAIYHHLDDKEAVLEHTPSIGSWDRHSRSSRMRTGAGR